MEIPFILHLIMISLQIAACEITIKIVQKSQNVSMEENYPKRSVLIVPYIPTEAPNNTYWVNRSRRRRFNISPEMRSRRQQIVSSRTEIVDGHEVVFRVVNGAESTAGSVPWQVGFYVYVGQHKSHKNYDRYIAACGGSLISPSRVLSAAHCFLTSGRFSDCYRGQLSSSDFTNIYAVMNATLTGIVIDLDETSYGKQHVKSPFILDAVYIQTIPYASIRVEYTGECLVSGFGLTDNNVPSKFLRQAYVEPVATLICNSLHHRDMSRMICTSDEIADVNQGDSGGPIVCFNTGDPKEGKKGLLVGVTCGRGASGQRSLTVFTRISSYLKLVNSCPNSRSLLSTVVALIINYALLLFCS